MRVKDIVIIKEDFTPPGRWKLRRVVKTHAGSDETIKVVTLKTSNGNEIKRPIVKLSRLPLKVAKDTLVENNHFHVEVTKNVRDGSVK